MALLRALIVDKRRSMRIYVHVLLILFGFECVTADDSTSALRYSSQYAIDLVVSGSNVGPVEGLSVVDFVDAGIFGRGLPMVIIDDDDPDDGDEPETDNVAPGAGQKARLPKWFGPARLLRAIRRVFADDGSA